MKNPVKMTSFLELFFDFSQSLVRWASWPFGWMNLTCFNLRVVPHLLDASQKICGDSFLASHLFTIFTIPHKLQVFNPWPLLYLISPRRLASEATATRIAILCIAIQRYKLIRRFEALPTTKKGKDGGSDDFLFCLESSPTRIGILQHRISLCCFYGFLEDVERLEYKRVFVEMAIPFFYHVYHQRVWLLGRTCWIMADSFWEPVQNWIWSTNARRRQCFLIILMIFLRKIPILTICFPSDTMFLARNMASNSGRWKKWRPKEKSEVKPVEGSTPKAGWGGMEVP